MLKKIKFNKSIAFLLALIVTVSGALAAIGSTLAATPINWVVTLPDGVPGANYYHVDVSNKDGKNGELTLTGSRAKNWASSEIGIARVLENNGETAIFQAVSPGKFIAYRSTDEGRLASTTALVYDSAKPYEYTISKNHSVLRSEGKTDTIPITMKDMNDNRIEGAVTWSSDDTSVATVDAASGTITAETASGVANIIGKFTDCYGQAQSIHYSVIVGKVTADLVVGPDGNGDYWLPVGEPDNVWQKVEEDGTPVEPPEYIYDTDGDPTDGNGIPAIKGDDGTFYIEDPNNIFTPINPDGTLDKDGTIWGGDDRKPGTDDDEKAVNMGSESNKDYWVDFGENVFAQVSTFTGKIGALKGGGSNEDPRMDPVMPIYDNRAIDGHFYYGPHSDQDGFTYFIGDGWIDGSGDDLLNSDSVVYVHSTDKVYYRQEDGTMLPTKPITYVNATGITLGDLDNDTIVVGDKQSAPNYTILPHDATNQTVIWSSSNSNIVSVNPNTGEVTGVAAGTATITATIKNPDNSEVKATYQITVKKNETSWDNVQGYEGETFWASGYEWIILDMDGNGNAFVISKGLVLGREVQFNPSDSAGNRYEKSTLRNACDGFYSGVLKATDTALRISGDTSMKRITDVAQPTNVLTQSGAWNGANGVSKVDESGITTCYPISYQEAVMYLIGREYAAPSPTNSKAYNHMRSMGRATGAGISSTYIDYDGRFDQDRNIQNRVYNYCDTRVTMWIKIK